MKKLLILDANSIVNRAFYAVRLLTNKEGMHTNAIFGFLNILLKFTGEISPDYIAAAFDLPAPTFRHKLFDGYKATRHKMPEELAEQIPVLKSVLEAMNISIFEKEGYEADDIIGTCARVCEEEDILCCVLTGDRDDLQLASEKVHIHLVTTRMGNTLTEVYDDKKVLEKYGVTPSEFIDLKAIMGDSSDNIPGVRGIGEKGATTLISAFHSIENVYENLESDVISKSIRTKLEAGKDDAYLSKTLATIDRFVPIDFPIDDLKVMPPQNDALFALFSRLEFKSFISRMGLTENAKTKAVQTDFWEGKTFETLFAPATVKKLAGGEDTCFLADFASDTVAFTKNGSHIYQAPFRAMTDVWREVFESKTPKCSHNVKELLLALLKEGIFAEGFSFDTQIAAYLLEPARKTYDLAELLKDACGIVLEEEKETGEQLSIDSLLEPKKEENGLGKRAAALFALRKTLEKSLAEKELTELFSAIEMPLVAVLASMEHTGIAVDKEKLSEFGRQLRAEIASLTGEIYTLAGGEFNINSPRQLGTILFETLGLETKKKTKSGYSTSAEVLEKLRFAHPIVEKILKYRRLSKLNATYAEGLLSVISPETGKIHSSFHQTVTVTGRISSAEPNLQNIPVRTPLGREMRKMFVAENEDFILVDADYSQIELRVLAHLSQDDAMIESFRSGRDIHTETAAKIFKTSPENVTDEMRSGAKAINFGLVYGMGEYSLSQDLSISVKEAKNYIEEYLGNYPKVKQFMHDTVEFAKQNGYVKTMFGRKRELPELASGNYQMRAFGERAAMNTPVQGTAADIIKLAMIAVYRRLKQENLSSRLILQVHDELIIEAKKSEEEIVKQILREEMENAAALLVPLKVDMQTGRSWYDAK